MVVVVFDGGATTAQPSTRRRIVKKYAWMLAGLALVVILGVACTRSLPGDTAAAAPTTVVAGSSFDTTVAPPTPTPAPPVVTAAPVVTAKVSTETVSQRAAVSKAQSYIAYTGFSKKGLIHQLTSAAGEGFSQADAEYAVAHIVVDWNAEAVEKAKSYMEFMPMSRAGLIHQLTSSAGEGFTKAEAEYAANAVGL